MSVTVSNIDPNIGSTCFPWRLVYGKNSKSVAMTAKNSMVLYETADIVNCGKPSQRMTINYKCNWFKLYLITI